MYVQKQRSAVITKREKEPVDIAETLRPNVWFQRTFSWTKSPNSTLNPKWNPALEVLVIIQGNARLQQT